MAAAAHDHGIVALFGPDIAQPWAGSHDIDDDAGDLCGSHIRKPILHEAKPGPRRRRHCHRARCAGAIEHVNGGDFAFGLDRQSPCTLE